MTFQFQCPQGHLLVGDESQAGQQCLCPMCGMLFIVPAPFAVPVPPVVTPPVPPAMPLVPPSYPEPDEAPVNPFAALAAAAQEAEANAAEPAKEEAPASPLEPALLHIPCPKGHVLETPEDVLDQAVLCPHCNTQFVLRRHNSTEHKRRKEEEERIREIKAGNFWLNWAIAAVVLVVLGLVALIVARSLMQTPVTQ